ncbi:UNVERIFIED_CONTAM: UDP-glycosyltransferase 73C3 [Sesamum angustifolium]|uniref:Glycosyltransferase n=1 Tax=Sesamum angustifolium TaxID=2727405 RepID=A0AAW2MS91_9LAMI
MASEVNELHFLLIPLMSQSHIIPLTDFAKLLAHRGVIVSIITTPRNSIRYKATIQHALQSGLTIQMIPLEFQGREVGLPPGCENMDSLNSMDLAGEFILACEMLKSPLEEMIKKLEPSPSCIISTNALPWTQQVADNFKIPRYIFETISCFTLLCSHKLSQAQIQETEISDSESFLVPDIPHRVEFTKAQLPGTTRKSSDQVKKLVDRIKKCRLSARGTLVNSFEELEPWYVEGYRKENQRVWCIGPVSLCNKNLAEKSDRGEKASIDEQYCISWLDSREPRSVIYACFGSLCRMSAAQIKEIGLGLEASNFAFIWIIRSLDSSAEVEKWLAEEKFEERLEGRGLIIRGWAPQVLILSHPSVGGFLTHCGWNSTLEGICAGLPMITWPMFAEQFYNEKFIVYVLKIGVRIGVEVGVGPGAVEEQSNALVKWDQVKKSIETLMDDDEEEGRDRRRRAQKLGEMAKAAIEQGGSSYLNITLLIQDVMQARK